jgi:PleD family two-component response regulator
MSGTQQNSAIKQIVNDADKTSYKLESRILIANDGEINCLILANLLELNCYTVDAATDDAEALQFIITKWRLSI